MVLKFIGIPPRATLQGMLENRFLVSNLLRSNREPRKPPFLRVCEGKKVSNARKPSKTGQGAVLGNGQETPGNASKPLILNQETLLI